MESGLARRALAHALRQVLRNHRLDHVEPAGERPGSVVLDVARHLDLPSGVADPSELFGAAGAGFEAVVRHLVDSGFALAAPGEQQPALTGAGFAWASEAREREIDYVEDRLAALTSAELDALAATLPTWWFVLGRPMLLLTTKGRLTERPHTVPLLHVRLSASELAVIGTNGGRPEVPDWVLDLQANPTAAVTRRAVAALERRRVHATFVPDVDVAAIWSSLIKVFGGWESYRSRSVRSVPVIRLATLAGDFGEPPS